MVMGDVACAGAAGTAFAYLYKKFGGGFNPDYAKEDQRKMRYILQKYAQAYGDGRNTDPDELLAGVNPNSR
jgi:hypothetical protein